MYQVVWQGIVHDQQGYARASREYLLALDRAGVDVKIEPLNFGTPSAVLEMEQVNKLKELIQKPRDMSKKQILVYHAQPYGIDANAEREHNGYDKVIINTVWETTKVPANWFPFINYADAVIVPSSQNVQALVESGVTIPILKVPHGSDTDKFNPDNEPFELEGLDDTFKFLSIFQWQHRKAPDKLFKAFWNEFSEKDNVALVVKSYWGNNALKSDQRAVLDTLHKYKQYLGKNETNSAPVYFSSSLFSDSELRGLYANTDVFVLPSRGEGVGLPYIEAMSSGIPCIATGWGGQTDFITDENGYLVDYKLRQTTYANDEAIAQNFFHLFTDDMLWAEADVASLQKTMRHTYENREEVKAKGKQAREDMKKMSWNDVGFILKDSIEKVLL
jgi:glycosyltransferase involved in cell wall biosynthesis